MLPHRVSRWLPVATKKFATSLATCQAQRLYSVVPTASSIPLVWKDMTVEALAKSCHRSVEDVFHAITAISRENNYQVKNAKSPIPSASLILDVVQYLGEEAELIRNPSASKRRDRLLRYSRYVSPSSPLVTRPPVVAIMGHVDHGKTTLLDSLRRSRIVDGEFGGITQHIGAFRVPVLEQGTVTFLDTPGHAAFKALRSRGANATDLVILVVAADDGVMEQTKESLRMAQDAGVPVVVAINKIDKANARPSAVEREIVEELGLQIESAGGNVQCVRISALQNEGLSELVNAVFVEATLLNLRGREGSLAEGVVLEAHADPHRGKMASVLVREGSLKKGTLLVAGDSVCSVRRMFDDYGKTVDEAKLSDAVQVMGWRRLPVPGTEVYGLPDIRSAIFLARLAKLDKQNASRDREYWLMKRQKMARIAAYKAAREGRIVYGSNVSENFSVAKKVQRAKFSFIIKCDVQGSLDAILDLIKTYKSNECRIDVVRKGVGRINDGDILFAKLFKSVIYTFNLPTPETIREKAAEERVEIRDFNVIYRLVEEFKAEIADRMPLVDTESILGEGVVDDTAEELCSGRVRCKQGVLKKGAYFKILRSSGQILESAINLECLKHNEKDTSTLESGCEGEITLGDDTLELQRGDRIICYEMVPTKCAVDWNLGF